MIYEYIHDIVTTFLIDYDTLSVELQLIVQIFELWGLFIFFKWCLIPVTSVLRWLSLLSKDIFSSKLGNSDDWRDNWIRKKRKGLKKEKSDD